MRPCPAFDSSRPGLLFRELWRRLTHTDGDICLWLLRSRSDQVRNYRPVGPEPSTPAGIIRITDREKPLDRHSTLLQRIAGKGHR